MSFEQPKRKYERKVGSFVNVKCKRRNLKMHNVVLLQILTIKIITKKDFFIESLPDNSTLQHICVCEEEITN